MIIAMIITTMITVLTIYMMITTLTMMIIMIIIIIIMIIMIILAIIVIIIAIIPRGDLERGRGAIPEAGGLPREDAELRPPAQRLEAAVPEALPLGPGRPLYQK